MKYATWKLNFENSHYGTGPEHSIVAQGFTAEGAFQNSGDASSTFLGYFTGEPTNLDAWQFSELTQAEALAFVQAIDATAHLVEDGKIMTSQGE